MLVLIWVQTVCKSYQQTSKDSKTTFRNTIRVSNSLDPYQDRHSGGPDLGPNRLQKLSADAKSKGHNVMCHNKLACNDCMMSFHYSSCSGRCDWEESD